MKILQELEQRYPALKTCMPEITQAASALVSCFWQDGKLLACGNGGSAADCEHIVGELMKAFRLHRRLDTDKQRQIRETYPEQADVMIANLQRAVPAISLVSQTALMTAFGNDVSAQMLLSSLSGSESPTSLLHHISVQISCLRLRRIHRQSL